MEFLNFRKLEFTLMTAFDNFCPYMKVNRRKMIQKLKLSLDSVLRKKKMNRSIISVGLGSGREPCPHFFSVDVVIVENESFEHKAGLPDGEERKE